MPWVRFGRQARWRGRSPDVAEHVTEAAMDLFNPRRREEGTSVYFAATPEEARSVAVVYALTHRDPGTIDYVLIPDAVLGEPPPEPRPDSNLVPYLSQRHQEILGMEQARAEDVARSTLQVGVEAVRLREPEILAAAESWLEDPEVVRRLTGRWARLLGVEPADE